MAPSCIELGHDPGTCLAAVEGEFEAWGMGELLTDAFRGSWWTFRVETACAIVALLRDLNSVEGPGPVANEGTLSVPAMIQERFMAAVEVFKRVGTKYGLPCHIPWVRRESLSRTAIAHPLAIHGNC
jgi:hypothetical protein